MAIKSITCRKTPDQKNWAKNCLLLVDAPDLVVVGYVWETDEDDRLLDSLPNGGGGGMVEYADLLEGRVYCCGGLVFIMNER